MHPKTMEETPQKVFHPKNSKAMEKMTLSKQLPKAILPKLLCLLELCLLETWAPRVCVGSTGADPP